MLKTWDYIRAFYGHTWPMFWSCILYYIRLDLVEILKHFMGNKGPYLEGLKKLFQEYIEGSILNLIMNSWLDPIGLSFSVLFWVCFESEYELWV